MVRLHFIPQPNMRNLFLIALFSLNFAVLSIAQDNFYYVTVENLRLRDTPSLNGKVLTTVDEGARLIDLGEQSDNVERATIRGNEVVSNFFKVKTEKGIIGWAFGGGLIAPSEYMVVASGLRMRKSPSMDADVITSFSNETILYGWGKHSDEMVTATLANGTVTDYFLYVESPDGKYRGWVFGGGLESEEHGD